MKNLFNPKVFLINDDFPNGHISDVEDVDYKNMDVYFDQGLVAKLAECTILKSTGKKDRKGNIIVECDLLNIFGDQYLVQWDEDECGFIMKKISDGTKFSNKIVPLSGGTRIGNALFKN